MQLSSNHVFIISPLEQKLSYNVHTGLSWVEPNIWLFAERIVGPDVHVAHCNKVGWGEIWCWLWVRYHTLSRRHPWCSAGTECQEAASQRGDWGRKKGDQEQRTWGSGKWLLAMGEKDRMVAMPGPELGYGELHTMRRAQLTGLWEKPGWWRPLEKSNVRLALSSLPQTTQAQRPC